MPSDKLFVRIYREDEAWRIVYGPVVHLGIEASGRLDALYALARRQLRAAKPLKRIETADKIEATFPLEMTLAVANLAERIEKRLTTYAFLPLTPRQVEEILEITSQERSRWSKDGRLPRSGTGKFQKGGQVIQYYTHSVERIAALKADPELIAEWRRQDRTGMQLGASARAPQRFICNGCLSDPYHEVCGAET